MVRLGLFISLLFTIAACGGDAPPVDPQDDALSTMDSEILDADSTDGATIEEISPPTCEVGARTCVDDTRWTACEEGGEQSAENTCDPGTQCLDGDCRGPLCTPDEVRCASWTVRRRCEASGLRWAAPEPCGTDEICHGGQCLTCFPGEATCATLVASTVCGEDGLSFPVDDITSCPADEHCHEPSGICLLPECSADETACAGSLGVHTCLSSGTRYSPEITPCPSGDLCSGAACQAATCPPHPVLFVVDRTSAIGNDWAFFQTAIAAAMGEHPDALYGFMPFPMAFGCPATEGGELPRFPVAANADVATWFDTVKASSGKAALHDTIQTILDRAHEIFGGNAGRIVLISSGSADCHGDAETIGANVAALRFDHGVRTFVIGHRASAGFYPALDAAHAQGGSQMESWPETSYDADLTDAVKAALEDVPSCD